jgi:hypothetical protein
MLHSHIKNKTNWISTKSKFNKYVSLFHLQVSLFQQKYWSLIIQIQKIIENCKTYEELDIKYCNTYECDYRRGLCW